MSIEKSDEVVNSVKSMATCEWCKQEFTPKLIKKGMMPRFCCTKCNQSSCNETLRLKNQEEFLKEHGDDPLMPVCKECGWKAFDLTTHITKFHKIPMKDYYKRYGTSAESILHPDRRSERSERKLGEKNPFYHHGGKFSAVSTESVLYEGLTEEEKTAKILQVKEKIKLSKLENHSHPTRIEYWLQKGYDDIEAREMLSNRQRTFSLEKCIEKYGEEDGFLRWKQRQEKWRASYDDKTEEEMIEINIKKNAHQGGTSNPALELFKCIDPHNASNALYHDREDNVEAIITTITGKKYSVDYKLGNKIIEFYGDLWHANPNKYKPDDKPICWSTRSKTAKELWEADERKLSDLENSGFEVLIIWEEDWKKDRSLVIRGCRAFLGLTNHIETEVVKEHV